MKQYRFKINGNDYNVTINSVEGKNVSVTVNGAEYTVELEETMTGAPAQAVQISAPVAASQPVLQATPSESPEPAVTSGTGKPVTAPLPGVILEVNVNVGDVVKTGQEVAVLEAMKMENSIEATHDGTVTAIHAAKGDSVLEGAPIVTIG